MGLSRETRTLLGALAAVVLLVIAYDVFFPPAPQDSGAAPAVEVLPEIRRGLDKTPLLYAEEYVRDLAARLSPALVVVEDDLGTASAGFVVSDDGEIVVALGLGPEPWYVVTGRRRAYEAELIALDEWNGLALLHADLIRPARVLEMAATGDVRAASTLIGLQLVDGMPAVRSLVAPGLPSILEARLHDLSLAPGEVIVDLDGRLVAFGARTPLGTRPILGDALNRIVAELRQHRSPAHPWIGVHLQTIGDALRRHFPEGALVAVHVERGSPGSEAGLREGMTFTDVRAGDADTEVVETAEEVPRLLSRYGEVTFVPAARGRAPMTAVVGDRRWPPGYEPASGNYGLAATTGTGGVAIAVTPGSPAALSGLRTGDVVEAVNRQPVATAQDLDRALARPGHHLVTVHRDGRWFYADLATEAQAPASAGRS